MDETMIFDFFVAFGRIGASRQLTAQKSFSQKLRINASFCENICTFAVNRKKVMTRNGKISAIPFNGSYNSLNDSVLLPPSINTRSARGLEISEERLEKLRVNFYGTFCNHAECAVLFCN